MARSEKDVAGYVSTKAPAAARCWEHRRKTGRRPDHAGCRLASGWKRAWFVLLDCFVARWSSQQLDLPHAQDFVAVI